MRGLLTITSLLIILAFSEYARAANCRVANNTPATTNLVITCRDMNHLLSAQVRLACHHYKGWNIGLIAQGLPKEFWAHNTHQREFIPVINRPVNLSTCRFKDNSYVQMVFKS